MVPSTESLPTLLGWPTLNPEQQAMVLGVCANLTNKPASPAPTAPATGKTGKAKKRKAAAEPAEDEGGDEEVALESLKVPELRERLAARGLDEKGKKAELLARLKEAMKAEAAQPAEPQPLLVD